MSKRNISPCKGTFIKISFSVLARLNIFTNINVTEKISSL